MKGRFVWLAQLSLLAVTGMNPEVAYSLPILAENSAQTLAHGLTLFPDSDNSNTFYYMPNSSAMARGADDLPSFGFTYWGLTPPSDKAGAYMTFLMKLWPDNAQMEAIKALQASGKYVHVLPINESTVGLHSTKKDAAPLAALFDEFNFSEKGGLAETEIGVNAILTPVGAKVFKASIDNPALMKIDFCYKVQGLGPNFNASVDVNWSAIYTHFRGSVSTGGFFSRAHIHTEIEKHSRGEWVKIVTNGGDATRKEEIRSVAETIIARLFKPVLEPKPGQDPRSGGWSLTRYTLGYVKKEELTTSHYELTERDLVDREYCSPLMIRDIHQYRDRLVKNADAN